MLEKNRFLTAMNDRFFEMTGDSPTQDSDIGIRFAVLAEELEKLDEVLAKISRDSLPQTAIGASLDKHAAQRGLQRKGAAKAQGQLRFSRSSPSIEDILLQAGIICSTVGEPLCRYITTADGLLPPGESFVDIPAEAIDGGSAFNTGAGAVSAMISAVGGVSAVRGTAFVGGTNEEGDAVLRERLLGSYFSVSNGTNSAFYSRIALEREGVSSVNVLPRKRGAGTVDIILGGEGAAPPQSVVSQLAAVLLELKEINVDVLVVAATEQPQAVTLEVELEKNMNSEVECAAIEMEIRALFGALGVAKPLNRAAIIRVVMEHGGVKNCNLRVPSTDISPTETKLIVPGSISITKVGAN